SSIKFTAGVPTDRRPPWSCASACILLLFSVTSGVDGGKILVWYTEVSHWINMKLLLETLVDRGHQVTVLVPSTSMFIHSSEPSRFNYQPFDVSVSKEDFENLLAEFIQFNMYDMDHMNYFQLYIKYMELFKINTEISLQFLDLRKGNYDVLLADPIYSGSDVTAEILGIPLVFSLRFSIANNWERLCGQLPAPPSYVPGAVSRLTDKINFSERTWNLLFYVLKLLNGFHPVIMNMFVFLGTPTSACKMMGNADIWLLRTYWDFDFPRPLLPNFKFVGGIHCKPAKPLPKYFKKFVQSSGDDGIVVFSLGSIVKNLTTDKANMIASALAQVPQKVRNGGIYRGALL
uniref:UDP glucuronosyltransferase 5 family, polypeptide F1 n=1 Tax=Nothobranchius furzeri TaxID=105023 RepID=A0A8C6NZ45_NOTFU